MNDEALILRDDGNRSVAFTEAANQLKGAALEKSALVGIVKDQATQDRAVEAQQEIARLLSLAEKARKACKEPVLDFGRLIDSQHRAFVADLEAERNRVGIAISDFQEVEAAKARAAERARQLEAERIEREKREAEMAALRIAEAERLKAEARQKELDDLAAKAKSKRQQESIEAQRIELERQKALSEAKSHAELDRINREASQAQAQLSEAPRTAPVRSAGQRVKEDWEVEIVDVWTLARAHPACVTITPRLSDIKDLLNAGVDVKGVRAKKVVKAGVTVPRGPALINV